MRRRAERVVRLPLDHRPGRHPHRDERLLHHRDLVEQLGQHPLARLVTVPQVVAERLDHVVARHADVGRTLLDQLQRRRQHTDRGVELADLTPRLTPPVRAPEVLPEQLVRPVDQMHLHRSPTLAVPLPGTGPGSERQSRPEPDQNAGCLVPVRVRNARAGRNQTRTRNDGCLVLVLELVRVRNARAGRNLTRTPGAWYRSGFGTPEPTKPGPERGTPGAWRMRWWPGDLRHTSDADEGCSIPGLTWFTGAHCTGPDHHLTRREPGE